MHSVFKLRTRTTRAAADRIRRRWRETPPKNNVVYPYVVAAPSLTNFSPQPLSSAKRNDGLASPTAAVEGPRGHQRTNASKGGKRVKKIKIKDASVPFLLPAI